MSKKRQEKRALFATTAKRLIEEVVAGKWDHVIPDWRNKPIEGWDEVLEEFSSCCPGHDETEYIDALRRTHWSNR
jgi:hypothetical protein